MAAIWAVAALFAAKGAALWTCSAVVAVALVPLAMAASAPSPKGTVEDGKRIARLVGFASIFEVVAIVAAVIVMTALGRPDLIVSVVAGVVGVHFLPLARWIPMPRYYLTGLALLAAACAGVVVPGGYRAAFVAGAASAILWASALSLVFSLRGSPSPARSSRGKGPSA